MGGSKLEQVNSKTCLGLILDNNFNFRQQVEFACGKAMHALNKLSIILNNFKNISIETGLYLYQSCIRCHLEYSFAVWSTASQSALCKLDQVQRKCLLRISGADYSTPSSSLEILCHIPPLRVRLDEVLQQELLRICRTQKDPVYKIYYKLSTSKQHLDYKILSPIHMMNMAGRETSRCGNFHSVEQVLPFQTSQTFSSNLKELKLLPDNIGNSRTRTMQQALSAKLTVIKYLQNMLPTEVIAFTDGSALGNPGPCGAGAVLFNGHMCLLIPLNSKFLFQVKAQVIMLKFMGSYWFFSILLLIAKNILLQRFICFVIAKVLFK